MASGFLEQSGGPARRRTASSIRGRWGLPVQLLGPVRARPNSATRSAEAMTPTRGRRVASGGRVLQGDAVGVERIDVLASENSRSASWSWISEDCDDGVTSARITSDAAAMMADAATTRKAPARPLQER